MTNLDLLMATLSPALSRTEFAFATLEAGEAVPAGVEPVGRFLEAEGWTLIAPTEQLRETTLVHVAGWALITLEVHSSLEAVGMMARIASALSDAGISANVVSAFYHDHVFVPWERRFDAVDALRRLCVEGAGE